MRSLIRFLLIALVSLLAPLHADCQQPFSRSNAWELFSPISFAGQTEIEPLLTTQWNQLPDPYNTLCPTLKNFNGRNSVVHTPAGCVPIALAQLMAYHRWPEQGVGTHTDPFFFGGGLQNVGGLSKTVNYAAHRYDWEKILHNDATTLEQFVLDCGVAVDTNYGMSIDDKGNAKSGVSVHPINLNASNTNRISTALTSNFGYASGGQYIKRADFVSWTAWFSRMKAEINAGHPVLYFIKSSVGGHCVVLDGYKKNNGVAYIHLNFGWGGSSSGFYPINKIINADYKSDWSAPNTTAAIVGIYPKPSVVGVWRDTMFDDDPAISAAKKAAVQSRLALRAGGTGTYYIGVPSADRAALGLRPAEAYALTWTVSGSTVTYQMERDKASGKERTGVLSPDGKVLLVAPGRKFVRESN